MMPRLLRLDLSIELNSRNMIVALESGHGVLIKSNTIQVSEAIQ